MRSSSGCRARALLRPAADAGEGSRPARHKRVVLTGGESAKAADRRCLGEHGLEFADAILKRDDGSRRGSVSFEVGPRSRGRQLRRERQRSVVLEFVRATWRRDRRIARLGM